MNCAECIHLKFKERKILGKLQYEHWCDKGVWYFRTLNPLTFLISDFFVWDDDCPYFMRR